MGRGVSVSTTARKRLHAIAHTGGLLGAHGAWWFWLRRHLQRVSDPGRTRRPPV